MSSDSSKSLIDFLPQPAETRFIDDDFKRNRDHNDETCDYYNRNGQSFTPTENEYLSNNWVLKPFLSLLHCSDKCYEILWHGNSSEYEVRKEAYTVKQNKKRWESFKYRLFVVYKNANDGCTYFKSNKGLVSAFLLFLLVTSVVCNVVEIVHFKMGLSVSYVQWGFLMAEIIYECFELAYGDFSYLNSISWRPALYTIIGFAALNFPVTVLAMHGGEIYHPVMFDSALAFTSLCIWGVISAFFYSMNTSIGSEHLSTVDFKITKSSYLGEGGRYRVCDDSIKYMIERRCVVNCIFTIIIDALGEVIFITKDVKWFPFACTIMITNFFVSSSCCDNYYRVSNSLIRSRLMRTVNSYSLTRWVQIIAGIITISMVIDVFALNG